MNAYKAAVIGLGKIGLLYDMEPQRVHPASHISAYVEDKRFKVVCAVDTDQQKRNILSKISLETALFPTFDTAVAVHALDAVDVVSICTPPEFHYELLSQLIESGIGRIIFCEKPLVQNRHEVEHLKELLDAHHGVTIIPNLSRRWNTGLCEVSEVIRSKRYGELKKISIRYTRGIYNTGAHLFDLIRFWTGKPIQRIIALGETETSSSPERSFSFYFEQDSGVTGYAEAMDDRSYYMFDIDLYMTDGKIEMRNSGDDLFYYQTGPHHLFEGFNELTLVEHRTKLLSDPCLRNAINNIGNFLERKENPLCVLEDAVYPLYVAEALEQSYQTGKMEEIGYE